MRYFKYFAAASVALICVFTYMYITAQRIPVLLYHHLLEESENTNYKNQSVITPVKFDEQMRWLSDNGYKTLTLDEMRDFIVYKKTIPGKRVMLTFDDGYLSDFKYAYPVLKKYGFTAAIFVVTSEINETPQPFDPDALVFMSFPEMEQSSDVFEFGSHTDKMHSMEEDGTPFIVRLSDEAVKTDFEKSFSFPFIKKYFAYPFGRFKKSNLATLEELNVDLAFTIGRGKATKYSSRYNVPRLTIRGNMTMEEFIAVVR